MKTNHQTRHHNHPPTERLPGERLRITTLAARCGLLAALLGLTACQQPAAQFPDAAGSGTLAPFTSTKLGEGDVIRVSFEADATMNTEVKIQLDGTVNLPLVGAVKATGLTPEELRTDLMARYKNLLSVNEITIKVVAASASVYMSGAVLKPGRIPMDRPLTALEAIMEAGGFDLRRAKVSSVAVIRKADGKQQHFELNLKKALKGQDPNPFYLKPYDIVHVPEKTFNL